MNERIPMVNVTARIVDQAGRPVQRARITMRLTTVERYCGLIVPREVSQYTDANGIAILRVWPNELGTEGSEYMVTIMYGDSASVCPSSGVTAGGCCGKSSALPSSAMSQRFRVVVPNTDCNLFDIADLPPYEQRGSGLVIPSEVAAYAAQAASNADRAIAAVTAVETARADTEALASAARLASEEAQAASLNAQKQAQRAEAVVDSMEAQALHFETSVVERTEKLATKMGQEAAACIKQTEAAALEALEKRSGEILTEISREGAEQKLAGRNAVNSAKEAAITEITDLVNKAETDFREEAALFGADFEALTERAETAAKRAGCSAASAANAATKACLCAERAERAADGVEDHRNAAEAAARKAEAEHACAEAAASRAQRAADIVQQNVDWAQGSAKAAQEAARAADCSAMLAKESAEIATAAQQAVKGDKDHVDAVHEDMERLAERTERGAEIAESFAQRIEELAPCVEANAKEAEVAAERAKQNAEQTDRDVEICKELKEAATQGAVESLENAEAAKADAAKAAVDRAAVEELARDVEKQIHDTALDMLTEQVVNEAVETATQEAKDAARLATEKAEAANADALAAAEDAKKARAEAINAGIRADRAQEAQKDAEDAAQQARTEAVNAGIRADRALAAQNAAEAAADNAAQEAEKIADAMAMIVANIDLSSQLIRLSDDFTKFRLEQIEQAKTQRKLLEQMASNAEAMSAAMDVVGEENRQRDVREVRANEMLIAALDRITKLELSTKIDAA